MKKVLILGAGGNIAGRVIRILSNEKDIQMQLFVRNKNRLSVKDNSSCTIIEGDVLNVTDLIQAMTSVDIVYANLSGELGLMAQNIVSAMNKTGVKRLIFISSIEIYDIPLKPVLKPYRAAADAIESSTLDYTIIRPAWFTGTNEVDYELTKKGQPERGSVISMLSLATFIAELIKSPELHIRKSLGINKPNS